MLGGSSNSGVSGNKTEACIGNYDYWLIKIDAGGNKLWEKCYGGTSIDFLSKIQSTRDGGYILGGFSTSQFSGDKTQNGWGSYDYWIVKIDSAGNKQWDKDYGGYDEDDLYDVQQTPDGGYILGGFSWSGIGGDKTQDNWDPTYQTPDYWLVKIDSTGNKLWDRTYGGDQADYFASLIQTNDGGYLLGGNTESDSGDNVTTAPRGLEDAWFIKTDSLGNIIWDLRLGGTASTYSGGYPAIQCADSSYILACGSNSDSGGDKTQKTYGNADYWIVKINSNGHKIWDKDFGGPEGDALTYLTQTFDGGYLMSGESQSTAGGDKSENNLGNQQVWMLKTDSLWQKQWDKTIFTTADNDVGYAIQTQDSCYAVEDGTWAGIGGYKTVPNWDSTNSTGDYWVVKFCFTGYGEGVKDLTPKLQFNAYPNPFTSELDITIAQQNLKEADFSICNLLGQTVYTQHETNLSPTYTKMLDLSYLPNGVYLVEVVVDGEVSVKEVIKQ